MPSTFPQVNARVTPAQLAAITEAARRANLTLADFLRYGAMMACHAEGVSMPDDMPGRGTYPRQPTSEDCPASGAPA